MTQPIDRKTAIALAKEAGMAGMLTDVVCSLEEIHRLCNLAVAHSRKDAEPVAWALCREDGLILDVICPDEHDSYEGDYTLPLYLHPPEADKLLQQALELFESSDSKLPAIAVKIRTYLENKNA